MLDVAVYTHPCGHSRNYDSLQYRLEDGSLFAALCDGLNGTGAGDQASSFCAGALLPLMMEGAMPDEALLQVKDAFHARQRAAIQLKNACTTACALRMAGGACAWANIGDSRLYHFSGGAILHQSVDDSAAYTAYLAGAVPYEGIRMHPRRSRLTACIGEEREARPHAESFDLSPGDALLVCSDGFWQYVYETEMGIDLLKSYGAKDWLRLMLIRLAHRSRLEGDNLTVLACRVKDEEGDGYGF